MLSHWAYFKRDMDKLEHVQRNMKRVMENCKDIGACDIHPEEVKPSSINAGGVIWKISEGIFYVPFLDQNLNR